MIQEVLALPKDPLRVSSTTILSIKVSAGSATVDQRYDMKTTKAGPDGNKRDVELVTVAIRGLNHRTHGCYREP